MKVIIDEREHGLFEKCQSIIYSQKKTTYVILSKEVIEVGDIIIKTDEDRPVLIIERKSFSDLLASIKDGRYEEQSYRLIHSSGFPPHSVIYLLEGMFSQLKNPADKKIIYSAMTSLNFFKGFSVHRTSTVQESAEWLLHMADKIEREFHKNTLPYYLTNHFRRIFIKDVEIKPESVPIKQVDDILIVENTLKNEMIIENKIDNNNDIDNIVNNTNTKEPTVAEYCSVVKKTKKDNITPENIGEIILCQIPGISSITAISIMKSFPGGFSNLITEIQKNPDCLDNIVMENGLKTRKINKSSIENIKKFLLGSCAKTLTPLNL